MKHNLFERERTESKSSFSAARHFGVALMVATTSFFVTSISWAQVSHDKKLDSFLSQGEFTQSAEYFGKQCEATPTDHQARLALGLTQFLQAIENLGQANFRYGLISKHARRIPLARLPVPLNENPEEVSYDKLRQVILSFEADIQKAESTLAKVDTSKVTLKFFIGRAQLDLNGDQALDDNETLWRIFSSINNRIEQEQANSFFVGVDGADVHWLRGYCHVLMAFCDFALAHDERELFDRCGQLLFVNIESPYNTTQDDDREMDLPIFLDAIAAIHLMHFKLIDPERMKSAHRHLTSMISQSRKSWELALAEKDNDQEWIPNPNQTGVMGIGVSRELITGWSSVLDELEAILEGEKLIPHWRKYNRIFGRTEFPDSGTGVNLRDFFVEARDFDFILSLQGTNLEPFLEEGPLSTPEAWNQLTRVFQGQFFGFAIWFN